MAFADSIRSSKTAMTDVATLLENLLVVRGSTSSSTLINTSSAAFVDYTSASVSVTVPSNCYVVILAQTSLSTSATGILTTWQITEDGVAIGKDFPGYDHISSVSGFVTNIPLHAFSSPAAGSHTYKIQWKTASGTAYSTRMMLHVYCLRNA